MDSLFEGLKGFMHAGFISFVIVLATVRAYFDKWQTALEEAGIPKVLLWGLVMVIGIYFIRMMRQCINWVREDSEDETEMMEVGMLPTRAGVIVLELQRCRKTKDHKRCMRTQRQCIKFGTNLCNHEHYPVSKTALLLILDVQFEKRSQFACIIIPVHPV
ncbi:hypothetical protein BJ165DRAFT_1405368 [Panaeolus papilionaceus]|nr:hypothetical protein BJ165DRAFT_1405368 [Panaeolus papilionaceus]